jgi:hypothetical protein
MLSDSLDDSPVDNKRGYKNQKLSSMDSKYYFPSPSTNKKSHNDEIDALFSPSNSSQGSPVADARNRSYNFNDSPTKDSNADYLANFVTESADLEDSILGELLGGGKKKTSVSLGARAPTLSKGRPTQAKLDPMEPNAEQSSTTNDNFGSGFLGKSSRASPPNPNGFTGIGSVARQNSANNESDFAEDESNDFPVSPPKRRDIPSSSSTGAASLSGKRNAGPSIDGSFDSDFADTNKTDGFGITASAPAPMRRAQPSFDAGHDFNGGGLEDDPMAAGGLGRSNSSNNNYNNTSSSFTYNPSGSGGGIGMSMGMGMDTTGNSSKGGGGDKDKEKDEDAGGGLGFIPSFMEPGRQNRRRR